MKDTYHENFCQIVHPILVCSNEYLKAISQKEFFQGNILSLSFFETVHRHVRHQEADHQGQCQKAPAILQPQHQLQGYDVYEMEEKPPQVSNQREQDPGHFQDFQHCLDYFHLQDLGLQVDQGKVVGGYQISMQQELIIQQ